MVDCDMCGKKNISSVKVKVESTIMTTCQECARFGSRLESPSERVNNFTSKKRTFSRKNPDENKFIIKNYGPIVKQARESKGLKQEQVAKQLNEKESIIHKVESGQFKPSFALAKKLEKFFSIQLIEELSGSVELPQNFSKSSETLTMEEAMLAALKKSKK